MSWRTDKSFKEICKEDPEIKKVITDTLKSHNYKKDTIDAICNGGMLYEYMNNTGGGIPAEIWFELVFRIDWYYDYKNIDFDDDLF